MQFPSTAQPIGPGLRWLSQFTARSLGAFGSPGQLWEGILAYGSATILCLPAKRHCACPIEAQGMGWLHHAQASMHLAHIERASVAHKLIFTPQAFLSCLLHKCL